MTNSQAVKLVDEIIYELNSIGGFDEWWDNVYDDDKEHIRTALVNTVLDATC